MRLSATQRPGRRAAVMVLALGCGLAGESWAGPDPAPGTPSKFSNRNSVANTRHNLTQRPTEVGPGGPINAALMDTQRNDYGQVCVYCHTPHGANTTIAAPLWNRTTKANTYQTYDLLNTGSLTQPVTQPGAASLTCLSCHDGTTAVDAIVNMPGSGRYNIARIGSDAPALLNEWPNAAVTHVSLQAPDQGCLVCHNPAGAGAAFPTAYDFSAFAIGTDLRNDHPVGIRFPPAAGPGTDFNDPPRKEVRLAYFDNNANGRADGNEIRLYNSGEGYEVECASCHDPHGVPSAGAGSSFNATFLRVGNAGSAVCLTCHSK
ncbi:MAG: cytochrome c3 family protein [Rhizobacter sp.]|nr:cytochrome c3 family protein [Rhizobacter sp.]